MGKLWKLKAEVVPVVIDALGSISHSLKFYLKKIDIPIVTSCLQKTAILGTAFILEECLAFQNLGKIQMSRETMPKGCKICLGNIPKSYILLSFCIKLCVYGIVEYLVIFHHFLWEGNYTIVNYSILSVTIVSFQARYCKNIAHYYKHA